MAEPSGGRPTRRELTLIYDAPWNRCGPLLTATATREEACRIAANVKRLAGTAHGPPADSSIEGGGTTP